MSSVNSKKAKTFKSMLTGLTCEKHKISHLTHQARTDLAHEETLAEVDVNAITSFIVNKDADNRLAGIYLIDSICQNVGGKYVPLFEEHIFPLIETTYRYGSSQTRKTLCKILNIWKSRKIFPIEILRNIYKAISNQQNTVSIKPSNNNMNYNNQNSHNNRYNNHHTYNQMHYQPPHYQTPYYQPHHYNQQPHYYQPQPQPPPIITNNNSNNSNNNNDGWHSMCIKYNISPIEYETTIKDLIISINLFIESPYKYNNGLFVETPQLKNANWTCPSQIITEFKKCCNEFNEYHIDITRKLYFICKELKHQGCNIWIWQNKLSKISPFINDIENDNKNRNNNLKDDINNGGQSLSICQFYNSIDGCRSGSNCQYLHVTHIEAEIRKKLLLRVENRYQYKDIKFIDDCSNLKITTFYTYFGNKEELKKKHVRSISLLYSKKLKICPNCSLRITSESFSKHMKWHFFRRNQILQKKRQSGFKSQQYGMYRNWYKTSQVWLNTNNINLINNKLSIINKQEINPFINKQDMTSSISQQQHSENNNKEKINNNINYQQSQILLNGISQIVICQICQEEFSKSCKEYNAQKDDWILKNACYIDGTTDNNNNHCNNNNNNNKKIVHRKCYELKKKQSIVFDEKELKPKLYNKNNTISKIEDQLNENIPINKKKQMNNKKRKINNIFAVSDDENDDDYNNENDNKNSNESIQHVQKKRKLNNNNNNNNKIEQEEEEEEQPQQQEKEDDEDDDDDEDDLAGMGIDDIDQQQTKTITISYDHNNNNNNNNNNKTEDVEVVNDGNDGNDVNDSNNDKDVNNDGDDIDIDDDDNDDDDDDDVDVDVDVDDVDDDDDEGDADIVLFDPNAYNETYARSYGYRGGY